MTSQEYRSELFEELNTALGNISAISKELEWLRVAVTQALEEPALSYRLLSSSSNRILQDAETLSTLLNSLVGK
jgi:hypothetical protein